MIDQQIAIDFLSSTVCLGGGKILTGEVDVSRLFSKSVCRPENVQSGQIVRNPGTTTLEKYKSQEMLIFENLCKSL